MVRLLGCVPVAGAGLFLEAVFFFLTSAFVLDVVFLEAVFFFLTGAFVLDVVFLEAVFFLLTGAFVLDDDDDEDEDEDIETTFFLLLPRPVPPCFLLLRCKRAPCSVPNIF